MAPRGPRVLILAGDTDGNLGDRALVMGMCAALRAADPDVQFTLVSGNHAEDAGFFDAALLPRGPAGCLPLIRAARNSDLIIVGGGGLFQDDDSLVKMPYWAARVLLARLCCRRVVGFALGVGRLRSRSGRACARLAFALMERITVRDPRAQAAAQPLTSKPVDVVPDPALLVEPAAEAEAERLLAEHGVPLDGRPLVGVTLRRWFHTRGGLIPHKYRVRLGLSPASGLRDNRGLLDLAAEACTRVVAARNAHVVLLPTYHAAHEGDEEMCAALKQRLAHDAASFIRIRDPRMYAAVARRLAVMLGGRMHPSILAAAVGAPCVGLAYNPKFDGFFDLIGRGDRVVDVEDFVDRRLVDRLVELVDAALTEAVSEDPIPPLRAGIRAYAAEILAGSAAPA